MRILGWLGGSPADLGTRGERIAARFLRKSGYRVLSRNVRTSFGEIDLICVAPDRRTVVFVEVKTRVVTETEGKDIAPEFSVHQAKRRKLLRLAEFLAKKHGWTDRPQRIDVVAVSVTHGEKPRVRHFESAVGRS